MRWARGRARRPAVALALVAVAACSGGDDSTTPTSVGSPVASTPGAANEEADGGAAGTSDAPSTATVDATATRPAGPALPGLLDTSDEPIPNDPSVRTGVLDNGLTYYVRENDNPGAKATLRLAVKAGSVDELTDVTGIAHFAEHMMFNGTERFPENELVDVLRGFGADFGPDVNAFTSFDETVYTLTVPDDGASVELGIEILEQWLSHATIDESEVVKERGVVLDEWRVRTQTVAGRRFDVAAELFLAGSAYEGRTPVGTRESIERTSEPDLRDFYDTWYRPDNVAVVVVGDIDADRVVADVEATFGAATSRAAAPPRRPDVSFPVDTEPQVGLHVDPDQTTVDVEVSLPIPGELGGGTRAARTSLLDSMIYDALIQRLDDDRAAGLAPFDRIVRSGNSFVATLDAPALLATTDEARVVPTLIALLDEYLRASEHGFTADETELARRSIRSFLDTRFDGRNSRQDGDIADALVESFLTGAPYPTIATEHAVLTAVLDAITPEQLDERFRARWANSAPHVIISSPQAVADSMPTEIEVLALITETFGRTVLPRAAGRELPDALMDRPAAATVVDRRSLLDTGVPIFDPVRIGYGNGVEVIVTPNDIVEGQVHFRAVSPGGLSRVDDADVVDGLYASEVVIAGGIADFDPAELARINAGVDVVVNAWSSPYADNFGGSAASSDVEVLLQLLHLYFTDPRFDPVALEQVRARHEPVVLDPASDPAIAGRDALLDVRYPDELRYAVLPTTEQFETLDLDGVERVWNDRHAEAGDWTFVFSGDLDVDSFSSLAASYLGTLPATGAADPSIDLGLPPPTERRRVTVDAGAGDTAGVTLLFTEPASGSMVERRVEADVATAVLSARLTDVVREELGDSYSPFVVSYLTADPAPVIETYAEISGSPERVDAIADVVLGEIADLAGGGMTGAEYERAVALVEERYGFVTNDLFLEGLSQVAVFPELGIDSFLDRIDALDRVRASDVTAYFAANVRPDRFVQVTVLPR